MAKIKDLDIRVENRERRGDIRKSRCGGDSAGVGAGGRKTE